MLYKLYLSFTLSYISHDVCAIKLYNYQNLDSDLQIRGIRYRLHTLNMLLTILCYYCLVNFLDFFIFIPYSYLSRYPEVRQT